MRSNNYKSVLKHAGLAATVLLLASGVAFGQTTVNLSVGPTTATQPDGTAVPMWGYSCAGVALGTATCSALHPAANTTTANTPRTTGSARRRFKALACSHSPPKWRWAPRQVCAGDSLVPLRRLR